MNHCTTYKGLFTKTRKGHSGTTVSDRLFILGPCVIESEQHATEMAHSITDIVNELNIKYFVFKASFDKANRTSNSSFRGVGISKGLEILSSIRERFSIPVLTDIHEPQHAAEAAAKVDILQIPAFLCRQTDLIEAAAKTGKFVNVKKGQFMAPQDMKHAVVKVRDAGNEKVMITERGTTFGYGDLVVDYKGFRTMKAFGAPLIFDATHSVQKPSSLGASTGGEANVIPVLARAALVAGCDGFFMETHDNPAKALSDGPNAIPLQFLKPLLQQLITLEKATENMACTLDEFNS